MQTIPGIEDVARNLRAASEWWDKFNTIVAQRERDGVKPQVSDPALIVIPREGRKEKRPTRDPWCNHSVNKRCVYCATDDDLVIQRAPKCEACRKPLGLRYCKNRNCRKPYEESKIGRGDFSCEACGGDVGTASDWCIETQTHRHIVPIGKLMHMQRADVVATMQQAAMSDSDERLGFMEEPIQPYEPWGPQDFVGKRLVTPEMVRPKAVVHVGAAGTEVRVATVATPAKPTKPATPTKPAKPAKPTKPAKPKSAMAKPIKVNDSLLSLAAQALRELGLA